MMHVCWSSLVVTILICVGIITAQLFQRKKVQAGKNLHDGLHVPEVTTMIISIRQLYEKTLKEKHMLRALLYVNTALSQILCLEQLSYPMKELVVLKQQISKIHKQLVCAVGSKYPALQLIN